MSMRHYVPGDFSNETKWLKFFGNKQILLVAIGVAITYACYKGSTFLFGQGFVGIVFGLIIALIIVAPAMIPVPQTDYIKGGGVTWDVIFIRKMIRKRSRVIYVKGWNKDRRD